MNPDRKTPFYTSLAIYLFFLLAFLLLVLFGVSVYGEVNDSRKENEKERLLTAYFQTALRLNEAAVSVTENAGRQVLIIRDGTADYGTKIYLSDGVLYEEYGRIDDVPDLLKATPIAETDLFEIDLIAEGLLRIRTDEGTVFLHLMKEGAR